MGFQNASRNHSVTECHSLCFVRIFQKTNLLKPLGVEGVPLKAALALKSVQYQAQKRREKTKPKNTAFHYQNKAKWDQLLFEDNLLLRDLT